MSIFILFLNRWSFIWGCFFSASILKQLWLASSEVFYRVHICDALRDLVAFVQLKKREKHPWRSVKTPPWVFFTFFKLYKCYQIAQRITYIQLKIGKVFQIYLWRNFFLWINFRGFRTFQYFPRKTIHVK